jgi:cobyrinic acid a,c-diamide synthase
MALVIAGERSGVGKTTITLALLAVLRARGLRIQSYKVGPDYIDPMFHCYVTGRACRNLDPMLTSETYVQQCFAAHTQDVDAALVEGVMGLFDGAAGLQNEKLNILPERESEILDFASTAHVARLLNLPVVLVLDCSRLSHSIAALVHGYRTFDPRLHLAGVILNRVGSDRHLELLHAALEPLNVPILGLLRRQEAISIPDRHLGLIPTAELDQLDAIIDRLAHLGETCFDWTRLLPLLHQVKPQSQVQPSQVNHPSRFPPVRVAIARDPAFNFYYADNLDTLEQLGAELIPWSPLTDETLPPGVQGLYMGGGFPEMFAATLADNTSVQKSVQTAIQAGMPTYAECGGLMYLCREIIDFQGQSFPMVGSLPTTAVMGNRLTLGYRRAIAQQDTTFVTNGQIVYGHEFHRSHLSIEPTQPLFAISERSRNCLSTSEIRKTISPQREGWHLHRIHASYIHLHWGACPELPARFLHHCQQFQR